MKFKLGKIRRYIPGLKYTPEQIVEKMDVRHPEDVLIHPKRLALEKFLREEGWKEVEPHIFEARLQGKMWTAWVQSRGCGEKFEAEIMYEEETDATIQH